MGAVLHTANIRLFSDQVTYTVNAAQDRVMIVDEPLAPAFAELLPALETVETVVIVGVVDPALFELRGRHIASYEELLAGQPEARGWADVDERDAASICFTTGTTGDPKGVAYSHRSILIQSKSSATQNALRIGIEDRVLVVVPMFHATAWATRTRRSGHRPTGPVPEGADDRPGRRGGTHHLRQRRADDLERCPRAITWRKGIEVDRPVNYCGLFTCWNADEFLRGTYTQDGDHNQDGDRISLSIGDARNAYGFGRLRFGKAGGLGVFSNNVYELRWDPAHVVSGSRYTFTWLRD